MNLSSKIFTPKLYLNSPSSSVITPKRGQQQ